MNANLIIRKCILVCSIGAIFLLAFMSCRTVQPPSAYIKIKQETPLKNVTHENLKKFMLDPLNKKSSVVVRDLTASQGDLISGGGNRICALIEKGLLEQGYLPRDRKVFQTVVEKMGENVDYKKIYDKTGVDLIFEVTQFTIDKYNIDHYYTLESPVSNKYNNNALFLLPSGSGSSNAVVQKTPAGYKTKFTSAIFKEDKKKYMQSILNTQYLVTKNKQMENYLFYNFIFYGFSIEIKVILLKDNLVAGVYKYTYTPCTIENGGCLISNVDIANRIVYYVPNDPFLPKDPDKKESSKVESTTDITDNLLSHFFSHIVMPIMFKEMAE